MKDFAHLNQALYALTKKNVQFIWSQECQNSFEQLRERLTSTQNMAYLQPHGLYILDTDASAFAIGAISARSS